MIDGVERMGNNRLAFAKMAPCGWGTPTTVGREPRASPRSLQRATFLAFTACDLMADGFALSTTRPLTDEELAKTNVTALPLQLPRLRLRAVRTSHAGGDP